MLEDENGESRRYSSQELRDLFRDIKDRVRCVVMNSCHSEALASAISTQIDCVIGTSTAIPDDDAVRFSAKFYEMLASGMSVQTAFNRGCSQI